MKIIENSYSQSWAIMDMHCPNCYPDRECGFVDGGLVHHGDLVEFTHEKCGHVWKEKIDLIDNYDVVP